MVMGWCKDDICQYVEDSFGNTDSYWGSVSLRK